MSPPQPFDCGDNKPQILRDRIRFPLHFCIGLNEGLTIRVSARTDAHDQAARDARNTCVRAWQIAKIRRRRPWAWKIFSTRRPHDLSVEIFSLQPHLDIKLEVVLLSIRADRIINLKLLIVLVHLELAASTSLSLNRSGEFCAFVLVTWRSARSYHGEACPARERGQQLQRWLRIKLQTGKDPWVGCSESAGDYSVFSATCKDKLTHRDYAQCVETKMFLVWGPKTILVVLHWHAGWGEISGHRRKSKQVAH